MHSTSVFTALLTFVMALSPQALFAAERKTQADVTTFLDTLESTCPQTLGAGMAGKIRPLADLSEDATGELGQGLCGCIVADLRTLPDEVMARELAQKSATPEVERVLLRCTARMVRPHFGAMCRQYANGRGVDAARIEAGCACHQREVDAMQEADLVGLLENDADTFIAAFEGCDNFE